MKVQKRSWWLIAIFALFFADRALSQLAPEWYIETSSNEDHLFREIALTIPASNYMFPTCGRILCISIAMRVTVCRSRHLAILPGRVGLALRALTSRLTAGFISLCGKTTMPIMPCGAAE
jgi:hypothetical protein